MASSFERPPDFHGVLPVEWLRRAVVEYGWIHAPPGAPISSDQYQPASLDLRLGPKAYRLRSSFLPETDKVTDRLPALGLGELDLTHPDGVILEKERPYLIPLVEQVNLPKGIRARCNPRSSTGRLDIFTRVITDRSHKFDDIEEGYSGTLFLEVVSRSFAVRVKAGLKLNQLRLLASHSKLSDLELLHAQSADPILYEAGRPLPADSVTVSDGLFLSVALQGGSDQIGYQARKNSRPIDLSKEGTYKPNEFWEPIHLEDGNKLILEPEDFYLLISKEAVRIPPHLAAEMTAYDPTSGELRTHYAGFFDPGFGHNPHGVHGTQAVMEVRAHDVAFMLEHGQKVCKLSFERMYRPPSILYGPDIGSAYQSQTRTLSRHFRPTRTERLRLDIDPVTDIPAPDAGEELVNSGQLTILVSGDPPDGTDPQGMLTAHNRRPAPESHG